MHEPLVVSPPAIIQSIQLLRYRSAGMKKAIFKKKKAQGVTRSPPWVACSYGLASECDGPVHRQRKHVENVEAVLG